MKPLSRLEVWFLTGGQCLYGETVLEQVADDSRRIAGSFDASEAIPAGVVFKPVLTSPEAIRQICLEANAEQSCIGVVAWMHTFSPAKMWIAGLSVIQKSLLHLHTQFNRDLPWSDIDMDFMNLNQSAHGDREFGFVQSRMRIPRKTVVGHWSDPAVVDRIGWWCRAAAGRHEAQTLKVARFGDNMRQVAVTEGDKVGAQITFGFSVNGYGAGDLVDAVRSAGDAEVNLLVAQYQETYDIAPALSQGGQRHESLREAARIEIGLRGFLESIGAKAFTDTFEDLGGLTQLPGLAIQRLMSDGYGFGAEGDWKTAALVRILKVMSAGLTGGTSFMEDYTYHLGAGEEKVLGAHMLEICPSIAAATPSCEIHALSIGGKADPVRLVFTGAAGPAVVLSLLDLGDRFRLLANTVEAVAPQEPLPKLPVARVLWKPRPDLKTSAECWLLAGGPHHTAYTQALPVEPLEDFAEMMGVELLTIDESTRASDFRKELRWNQAYYRLARAL